MSMSNEEVKIIFTETEQTLKLVAEFTKNVIIDDNSICNTKEFRAMQSAMDEFVNVLESL